ncbi:OmpP1/FadL family transporter [Labilibacter marinus]|uniref:OmpP1/FadL family transporter n=1 Tax=Labilibacter marinus TaxID=1477105 RepID=UPI00082CB16D|nr:outer membrane protein transport protein [Labilibacter marinus]
MKRVYLFFLLAVLCFITPTSLKAIDGYFMLGYGTISKGMGGTGVAYYKTSIIANNPAGRAYLGTQYSVVANLMMPSVSYTITGMPSGADKTFPLTPGTVDSDISLLFIPNIAANWQLNEKSAFGFSISGSGIATDYPTITFFHPLTDDPAVTNTGVNFMQLNFDPSYSYKISEKHSFGVSAILTYQRFKADGLAAFGGLSTAPTKLTDNDFDSGFGFGFKIGYMGEVLDGLHLGATYQSKSAVSEFEEYAGLFAEQGSFHSPSNWTVGLNYEVSDKVKVLFDVQQINYSEVKAIGNPMQKLLESIVNQTPDGLLGADDGAGFGWEDMTIFKVGGEFAANETLKLRAGAAFAKEPIPSSEVMFNILAPAINNNHFTLGATKTFGTKAKDLNIALVYAPKNTVKGANPMEAPNQQEIELEMGVFEVELSLTF